MDAAKNANIAGNMFSTGDLTITRVVDWYLL